MTESQRRRPKTVRCFRAEEPRSRIGSDVAAAEVASELAHQLNNPLQALTNAIYLARLRITDSEIKGLLEDAESRLARMASSAVFLLTRGHDSVVLKSTAITAHTDGAASVVSAELQPSEERSSELTAMMDYMPARVINGEGREGDMLNLVFVAQPEDLQQTFARAGWIQTDDWKPIFVWHLLRHRNNDAKLPMARLFLFGRVQDYSYALPDPHAIVTRRHHLRIWKTDYTMDGVPIWVGAASHDVAIVFAKRGHIINHRIDPEVDTERDFVGYNLAGSLPVSTRSYLYGKKPVFEAQTSSGDSYHSDGRILFLNFHSTSATKAAELDHPSAPFVAAESLLEEPSSNR